jgi:ATP-dependent Lhr-like helicase
VSVYAYADFLTRWQHLHPAEHLSGPGGLVRSLQQMRGVPAPGVVWERDLLPLRVRVYEPSELEGLCQRGEVVWVASGGRDPGRARVRFFFRGEGHLFLPPEPEVPDGAGDLSPAAQQVLEFLKEEGASFTADLEEGTGLLGDDLSAALVELAMAGLVTNDSLHALRQVLARGSEDGARSRASLSSLEAELAAWRQETRPAPSVGRRPPSRARVRAATRTAARQVERASTPLWPGRWSPVHRIGVWGKELPYAERIERQARQLLQCYGVVTRQSLERDPEGGWDWSALYPQFQLMEMRGEVRRGFFVRDLPGIQFALPEAVERLREWTRPDTGHADELVLVNGCDPANLFGPARTGSGDADADHDPARFMRIPANYVVLVRGRPVLLLELGAERVTSLPDTPHDTLHRALALAVEHAGQSQRRLMVKTWNGEPVLDSRGVPLLEGVGFRREALVYVWDG